MKKAKVISLIVFLVGIITVYKSNFGENKVFLLIGMVFILIGQGITLFDGIKNINK